jgi:NitT/TauT family transport system ATP-binding protein
MEIVRDHGGQMDVFNLDQLTEYDFGHTLAVVKAGEMLEFLDTPKNQVLLTDLGRNSSTPT